MGGMEREARVRILDDLGGLEVIEAVHRRPRFARHAHATYALGVVTWGVNRFRARGATHAARAGALCTVCPDEAHEVEPAGDPGFAYRCLYPSVELVRAAAAALAERSPPGAPRWPPVIEDPTAVALATALFRDLSHGEVETGPLAREARLLALLSHVLVRHASAPIAARPLRAPAGALERAREHLAAHLAENVPLSRLAEVAGLEPFALLRAFARAYGLPPHAWLVQARVRRAQALLREGLPPGEVAAAVGFADQSHLTRHFKRVLGITPGCYRRGRG